MKSTRRLLKETMGSVSLELALYTGIMIFAFWFAAEAARQVRFHNNVERAAGTMADIMINQILPEDDGGNPYSLTDMLEMETLDPNQALGMVSDMIGLYPGSEMDGRELQPGIRVTYLDNVNPADPDGKYGSASSWESGLACPIKSAPDLHSFARNLEDIEKTLKFRLVMVETCTDGAPSMLKSLVFPANYYSYFIASAKL
jgi:hypothetical protein